MSCGPDEDLYDLVQANDPFLNDAPIALAKASTLSGYAPLQVEFTGSDSRDDQGIVEYFWNFSEGSSKEPNPVFNFQNPGVYPVSLRVKDSQGLESTAELVISVNSFSDGEVSKIACSEGGKQANENGRKIWCWDQIEIPSYSGKKGISFSNGELHLDSECYEQQVFKTEDRIRFKINPTGPTVGSWCANNYNMRAEIRTSPWLVNHAPGTEEWFGWSYYFGENYIIDTANQWSFFQTHNGINGENALFALWVIRDDQFRGHQAGEIYVVNSSTPGQPIYSPTGITPSAGQKIDVVVKVVWGDEDIGYLQVWINGNQVYSSSGRTITPSHPFGGNAKWGIYKWPWRNGENVSRSASVGVTSLEASMGSLRMITRKPWDPDYGKDSYFAVSPEQD